MPFSWIVIARYKTSLPGSAWTVTTMEYADEATARENYNRICESRECSEVHLASVKSTYRDLGAMSPDVQ